MSRVFVFVVVESTEEEEGFCLEEEVVSSGLSTVARPPPGQRVPVRRHYVYVRVRVGVSSRPSTRAGLHTNEKILAGFGRSKLKAKGTQQGRARGGEARRAGEFSPTNFESNSNESGRKPNVSMRYVRYTGRSEAKRGRPARSSTLLLLDN